MTAAWKDAGAGPTWVPVLNAAEVRYGIPTDLLARMAYQESTFRPGVISGAIKSSAGAVGLMQLMPQFFPTAGQDTTADIATAGSLLASLFARFGDWQVAVAAYNWGRGNVHHEYAKDADTYVLADMPLETQNYVRAVFTDVPIQGALLT